MNKSTITTSSIGLILVLLLVLLTGCASDDSLKVSFDGSECVLSGPAEVEADAHLIDVQNTTEGKGWLRVCWTKEGYTWQDILDFDFTDDEDVDDRIEWPPWCLGNPSSSVASADEDSVVYEYKLRQEGMYFFLWEQDDPEIAFRCGPLSVVKPEAE
jgi:hypothetical protein